ncbi:MAG: 16S rRNA (cytidine(1402)-2'-O)-methyltransferase [Ignavibacteria bacterium]|nr:16S rRNA (cytidine(1402)-2'-O)-methyltransferase [Ignavibacteria bacterium]
MTPAKVKSSSFDPALYIVPTPIGNIDDITVRGLKILRTADVIFCEDTRTTGQLLKLYGIQAPKLQACHEHNEQSQVDSIIHQVHSGKVVALVSDAGTPLISDPGNRIVKGAIAGGIPVVSLPGTTAFVPALVGSGLESGEFIFMGFPPHKKGRSTFLKRAQKYDLTVIFYESPHRVLYLVEEIGQIWGSDVEICVAREITKLYEEFLRGTASEVEAIMQERVSLKGEFVVVVGKSGVT